MNILIAEDDPVSAIILHRLLSKMGHRVTTARDGREAWHRFCTERYNLVVTDWMMPEMDGVELCRRIRADDRFGYTYVILLTAKDRREDRLEGLGVGADDILIKPLDAGELSARLNTAARILMMQDELANRALQMEDLHREMMRQNERLADANARLESLATTDSLTGLANHRRFYERLNETLVEVDREGSPLCVLLMDIDHFKHYNDLYGHPAGDAVLRSVAGQVQEILAEKGLPARYGGEEFAIILPGHNAERARALAEQIRLTVASFPFAYRAITLSIGLAEHGGETETPAELVKRADRALYAAKHAGRNQVFVDGGPGMAHEGLDSMNPDEPELSGSDHLEFTLTIQPSVAFTGGYEGMLQTSSVELLYGLIQVLDQREGKPLGHSERLARYALRLAQECLLNETECLTPGDLRDIAFGALLHDIGNLRIPEAILHKSGDLDPYEAAQIHRHPEHGVALLAVSPVFATAMPVVRHHHEWWDGSGYPDRLAGEVIPVAARILAVVDSLEAMTSPRPGRRTFALAEACAEIEQAAGQQYDPKIVAAFLRITESEWHAVGLRQVSFPVFTASHDNGRMDAAA